MPLWLQVSIPMLVSVVSPGNCLTGCIAVLRFWLLLLLLPGLPSRVSGSTPSTKWGPTTGERLRLLLLPLLLLLLCLHCIACTNPHAHIAQHKLLPISAAQ
jgi:hypothetical protein